MIKRLSLSLSLSPTHMHMYRPTCYVNQVYAINTHLKPLFYFQVILHEPGSAGSHDDVTLISPGTETLIAVTQTQVKRTVLK